MSDRVRSAWLTVGRLAPNCSAMERSDGSRVPSARHCSMMNDLTFSDTSSESLLGGTTLTELMSTGLRRLFSAPFPSFLATCAPRSRRVRAEVPTWLFAEILPSVGCPFRLSHLTRWRSVGAERPRECAPRFAERLLEGLLARPVEQRASHAGRGSGHAHCPAPMAGAPRHGPGRPPPLDAARRPGLPPGEQPGPPP